MSYKKGGNRTLPALRPEEVVRIASEAGAKVALDRYEQERQKAKRENADRRLRNTKLLLRNYRTLMSHCESAIFDIQQIESEDSPIDILYELDNSMFNIEMHIESIKRTAERTYIMMNHVNAMLSIYELSCARSPNLEDRRRYQVLHDLYIADVPKTARDIADEQHIDMRTVYKDIDIVTERLSALLFGIYGLNVAGSM
jgi:hypothetical protein